MTSLKSKLQLALLNRKKSRNLIEKGFTLVELMIVIVIVGILSATALPNFLNQTKKAAATEANQAASNIFKQAHAHVLQYGYVGDSTNKTTVDTTCELYAGTLNDIAKGGSWDYTCGGTDTAFTIEAKGDTSNNNTKDQTVLLTGDAVTGIVDSIVTSGADSGEGEGEG